MAKILVVDDERSIRNVLKQVLEYDGHRVRVAPDGPTGLVARRQFAPDVTLLDVKMPNMDGLQVLESMRKEDPGTVVIMISGHGTISTAVEATQKGAFDFLEKPLDTERLQVTLRNALLVRGLSESVERLRQDVEIHHEIVGASPAVRAVLERIDRVGATEARVLVTGENGTGKDLAARAIHRLSPRADQAFVDVNCAAIPATLIESELFGHVKGAFTDAVADRVGKFEQAHKGTLFLDEVGDMSPAAQAKVLKALEDGVVTRVGGVRQVSVDVRVVAATNKDLEEEIAEGRFREDLYYRLNVVPIHMPPLRARSDDIPMLVTHFAALVCRTGGFPARRFLPEAVAVLQEHAWPGNVRELKNTVERLLILSTGETVGPRDVAQLGAAAGGHAATSAALGADSLKAFREASERAFLEEKLRACEWNVTETAARTGITRANLYQKMRKHGLHRGDGEAEQNPD